MLKLNKSLTVDWTQSPVLIYRHLQSPKINFIPKNKNVQIPDTQLPANPNRKSNLWVCGGWFSAVPITDKQSGGRNQHKKGERLATT